MAVAAFRLGNREGWFSTPVFWIIAGAILVGTVVTAVTVIAFKHIGNARKRVAEATVSEPAPVNA